jgi:signal transduction histidine kinase
MRWGILVNLAVILAVSGALLFVVFGASLERAMIDDAVDQAILMADLMEDRIRNSDSEEEMWQTVRRLCKPRSGLRPVLYDAKGVFLGGCRIDADLEKPDTQTPGRRMRVEGGGFPMSLVRGALVVVDLTGQFPHGVSTVRGVLELPRSGFSPAWQFFAAYLVLTQIALFFLGYLLFHRTVIGPIRDVAQLAGKVSGLTAMQELSDSGHFREDIQKISASLRGMITRIVEDRSEMERLVEQLQKTNQELAAAQEGLVRSEKMAATGRLAAGLAHEIGNPLQILMGYVELLQRGPTTDSSPEIMERMNQELKRIHEILGKLIEFARPTGDTVQTCDINALVRDCGSLLKGRKGFRDIEVVQVLDPGLEPVETQPEKVRQVLINLLFNAADAMPESGGKIVLRTRGLANNLEIEVEDNGSGVPSEVLSKVFDPFFTTKEPGRGTGLGLAVCLSLVESLGGTIDIRSEEGKGTAVLVRLPLQFPSASETEKVTLLK